MPDFHHFFFLLLKEMLQQSTFSQVLQSHS
jgi:hypothetical protein